MVKILGKNSFASTAALFALGYPLPGLAQGEQGKQIESQQIESQQLMGSQQSVEVGEQAKESKDLPKVEVHSIAPVIVQGEMRGHITKLKIVIRGKEYIIGITNSHLAPEITYGAGGTVGGRRLTEIYNSGHLNPWSPDIAIFGVGTNDLDPETRAQIREALRSFFLPVSEIKPGQVLSAVGYKNSNYENVNRQASNRAKILATAGKFLFYTFEGVTAVGGTSGTPLFNAEGKLAAIHASSIPTLNVRNTEILVSLGPAKFLSLVEAYKRVPPGYVFFFREIVPEISRGEPTHIEAYMRDVVETFLASDRKGQEDFLEKLRRGDVNAAHAFAVIGYAKKNTNTPGPYGILANYLLSLPKEKLPGNVSVAVIAAGILAPRSNLENKQEKSSVTMSTNFQQSNFSNQQYHPDLVYPFANGRTEQQNSTNFSFSDQIFTNNSLNASPKNHKSETDLT